MATFRYCTHAYIVSCLCVGLDPLAKGHSIVLQLAGVEVLDRGLKVFSEGEKNMTSDHSIEKRGCALYEYASRQRS